MQLHQVLLQTLDAPRRYGVWTRRLVQLAVITAVVQVPVSAPKAQQGAPTGDSAQVGAGGRTGTHQTAISCGTITPTKSDVQMYDQIVADAQRCAPEEKCVIAGGVKGCRCAVAVREDAKQRVDKAAREASCDQVERLYCPPLKNPRCEKQKCVADQVRE